MVARAPRKRMYRTMQGRMVDIEKLRAANENVRAQPPRRTPPPQPEKTVQKMTPVAPKVETPKQETKVVPKTVETFKPKTAEKKGIDAALDGLE